MYAKVYKYANPETQQTAFRGYVQVYHGQRVERVNCEEVRRTYKRAEDDAKKLLAQLKKQA